MDNRDRDGTGQPGSPDLNEAQAMVGDMADPDRARIEWAVQSSTRVETRGSHTRPGPAPLHFARDLTGGGRQALIRHGESTYSLTNTRAGKLILTK